MKTKVILIICAIIIIIVGGLLLIGNGYKDNDSKNEICGIENCHGLDISCGVNIPEFCTEIYMLGDFCRQYVSCEIINGKCQLEENIKFNECKACVEKCSDFECENKCREKI